MLELEDKYNAEIAVYKQKLEEQGAIMRAMKEGNDMVIYKITRKLEEQG